MTNEASVDHFKIQKDRLREAKNKQIEAISQQASDAKERVRDQYNRRVEAINRQKKMARKVVNAK